MALGNGYRNAAADDHSCGSSDRQYLAPRGPQPLVDHTGIHSVVKLDRPVGVCIHALAESRQLECPLWVRSAKAQPEQMLSALPRKRTTDLRVLMSTRP